MNQWSRVCRWLETVGVHLKNDSSYPTISTEALMLSCIMDYLEGWDVATVDILGYFLHTDMYDIVNMQIDG